MSMYLLGGSKPAFDQETTLVHDRMGNRDNVGVNALQIAQNIEMQRAGLKAVGGTVAEAF